MTYVISIALQVKPQIICAGFTYIFYTHKIARRIEQTEQITANMPDKRSMPGMCILSHDHANGKNCEKPMNGGCKNNWTWSKRYRSQEAVLEDETFSRGR